MCLSEVYTKNTDNDMLLFSNPNMTLTYNKLMESYILIVSVSSPLCDDI